MVYPPPASKKMPNDCPPFNLVRDGGGQGGGGGGEGGLMKPFFFLPKIPTKKKLPHYPKITEY